MKFLFIVLIFGKAFGFSETDLCAKVKEKFDRLHIPSQGCGSVDWEFKRSSKDGYPLLNKRFGTKTTGMVLLMCGVHGDEHSSPYLCFETAQELDRRIKKNEYVPSITIAPLVNPDGFIKNIRTNANGIDVNRNLPTKDFQKGVAEWKKTGGDQRKYPGTSIQVESTFQVKLLETYKPSKIVSIHSPLSFVDYDGPSFKWALDIATKHKDLPLKNYQTFVGSLGRFAGEERNIPTFTIELTQVLGKPPELQSEFKAFFDWILELEKNGTTMAEALEKESSTVKNP